jgi:hypothetical protein
MQYTPEPIGKYGALGNRSECVEAAGTADSERAALAASSD